MKIHTLSTLSPRALAALVDRRESLDPATLRAAGEICEDVRVRGDDALRDHTERLDGVRPGSLRVSDEEIAAATASVSAGLARAIEIAAAAITTFHEAQLLVEPPVETLPGVTCWRERRPIETVGLYVPAGSAPLPSTVLMLGIPARLAGCGRVVLCSPPRRDGSVDPTLLFAARLVGIDEIYTIGGAQAIAAMAHGTGSVPRVEKIFGPGNRWVAAAKMIVASDPAGPAIDLPAGPSELLVIADISADPRVVAADLTSQAEHDPDARVALVTDSERLALDVAAAIPGLSEDLPRRAIIASALERSCIVVARSLDEAVAFANLYAPEHLIVNVEEPDALLPAISSAGSVFVGPYAPVTAGDYASGTNHTLPTGGAARWTGGLSVESFQKIISFQRVSADGLRGLAPTLMALSEAEGLAAHGLAVSVRLAREEVGAV
jgi:histidinol dehydrogenase